MKFIKSINFKRIILYSLLIIFVLSFFILKSDLLEKVFYNDELYPGKNTLSVNAQNNSNNSIVAIMKSDKSISGEIQYSDIDSMVRKAVELAGGLNGLVREGSVVVIKPNLVVKKHSFNYTDGSGGFLVEKEVSGITTDWRVVKAVVGMVRELNKSGKIYVMEGCALEPTKPVMEYLNYTPEFIPGVDEFIAIEEDSGAWQDFNSPGLVKVGLPDGLLNKEYYLNKKYKEADVVISVPCLKTHADVLITGGIKNVGIGATPANIYGNSPTYPFRLNYIPHDKRLHMWIHDFFMCRPADFVITDGLQGFQNGPVPSYKSADEICKDQMNMRVIIAGRDPVAVDTVSSLVMQCDPEQVPYLVYLSKSKAGKMDTREITVLGSSVQKVRKDFGVPQESSYAKVNDLFGPDMNIDKWYIRNSKLYISLSLEKETVKVEAYMDDMLCRPTATTELNSISIELDKISKGSHDVRICAYDRFLNSTEETIIIKIK